MLPGSLVCSGCVYMSHPSFGIHKGRQEHSHFLTIFKKGVYYIERSHRSFSVKYRRERGQNLKKSWGKGLNKILTSFPERVHVMSTGNTIIGMQRIIIWQILWTDLSLPTMNMNLKTKVLSSLKGLYFDLEFYFLMLFHSIYPFI
jgi:hypothetical protein